MLEHPRREIQCSACSGFLGQHGGPVAGKGAIDGRNACFGPTIIVHRAGGVMRRRAGGEGWRRKCPLYYRATTGMPAV